MNKVIKLVREADSAHKTSAHAFTHESSQEWYRMAKRLEKQASALYAKLSESQQQRVNTAIANYGCFISL